MAFLYPWGNTQQLNLDWILQKIKELESGGGGGASLDDVANALISASYAVQTYDRSDIVFRDGKLYRANQAIPAPGEVWTPAHWDEILLGDAVSNLVQYVAALSNDQIINSSSVSGDHTSDALDTLKNAIDGITLDSDSVSNESQVTGDNVTDALDNLNGAITSLKEVDTAIENGLAIVANGNTHAAIASGQYVYIKGHSTLAEGLYKATTAIPLNGTLSASNVVASNDVLNNLTWQSGTVTKDTQYLQSSGTISYLQFGKTVIVIGTDVAFSAALPNGDASSVINLITTPLPPAKNDILFIGTYMNQFNSGKYTQRFRIGTAGQLTPWYNDTEVSVYNTCFFTVIYETI